MVEMMTQTGLLIACFLDLLLGDPEWSFHPIRILGKTIDCLEKFLRGINQSIISEKSAGILLCLITTTSAYIITFAIIHFACMLNSYFGASLAILLAYFTISINMSYRVVIDFVIQNDEIIPIDIGSHDEVY